MTWALQKIWTKLVLDNPLEKVLWWLIVFIAWAISPTELNLLWLVLFFFFMDFFFWVWKARKYNIFKSWPFKKGIQKWVWYLIYITCAIWFSYATHTNFILWILASWLVINDIISVLENMSEIGFKIPSWLWQSLKLHKNKFFNEMIRAKFTDIQFFDYEEDIQKIRAINLKTTPADYRLMYEYTIDRYEQMIQELFTQKTNDKETFLLWLNIMLISTKWEIIDRISKTWISLEDKARFMRWYKREEDKLKTYINGITIQKDFDLKWIVNGTYQFLIKILYSWVFWVLQKTKYDTINLTQEEIDLVYKKI